MMMDEQMATPTGRRVRCPTCGQVVAEVGPKKSPSIALHYGLDSRCKGFGYPSAGLRDVNEEPS